MLAIKLKRVGKRHQPSYRVVIAEKRSKLDGRFVDDLGFYNPSSKEIKINATKALEWISKGAQPTDTVFNLLIKAGIIKGKKRPVHAKSKKQAEVVAPAKEKTEEAKPIEEVKEVIEKQTETPKEEVVSEKKIEEENETEEGKTE